MKKLMMTLVLMPMMALATTWYVNGSSGSDSNSGKSQSSAKRTIQAAINSSSAGDTILVAPGTYAPITTDNKAITIKSSAGASSTVIEGAGASQRCVTACADEHDKGIYTNTVIIGFTLQNGDGHDAWGGCANGGIYKGCVLLNGTGGNAGNAILENCLVKGGRGINGGNLIGCVVRNCTIVDGYAEDNGGAYYNCAVFNSICYNNDSGWQWGDDGGMGYQADSSDWGTLVVAFGGQLVNVYKDDPGFMDAANGDYRLAAGSPCIDAGDNSYVTSDKDLAGNARIANGMVDIGCYEYGSSPVGGSVSDGLVAYYPFDGNANDASGNGNHLSNAGGAVLTVGHDGTNNGAYYFDGSDNSKLHIDSCLVVSNNFSFALWFKTSVDMSSHGASGTAWNPGNDVIHSGFWDYCYTGAGLRVGTDGIAIVEHAGLYRPTVFSYSNDLGSGWHHVAVVVSNGSGEVVYLDGQYVGTAEINPDCLTDIQGNGVKGLRLDGDVNGVGGGMWGLYTGSVDDLRIYNRALSAAEVKALYDGTGVTPTTYYTVTFNANGGSVSPTTRSVASGAAVGTLPTPTRNGYTFAGWWTAASGGSQVSASTKVYGNKTYYAHWTKINSVRLTVKSNSTKYGTVSGGGKYGAGATATLKAKAKKGYAFAGWFKDKSCKKALNPKGYDNRNPTVKYTVPAGDTPVYAKFISKKAAKKSLKFSSATKKLAKTPKKVKSGNSLSLSLGISSATITKVTAKGTAREGVKRLGKLLEKYGTYESNGIAINDENDLWCVCSCLPSS